MPWWKSAPSKSTAITGKKTLETRLVFQLPEYEEKGFEAIVERSLFNPARRTFDKTPIFPTKEIKHSTLLKVKIRGIVANGKKKMILVEKDNKIQELYLGAKLDGWVLKNIEGNSVIFSDGKTEIDILETNRNAKKQAISRNTTWLPKTRRNK